MSGGTARPVLEVERLSRRFDDVVAVDAIDLEVEEGSFFSILGPSGCGKTTLLRMIAGFLAPTAGSLRIAGREMTGVPPNRRPVNLVFQNLALFPTMDVAGNIGFGLKRRRLPKADIDTRVASILERVGLAGYQGKRISQLSGGQQQRVAIARALVLKPSILLLDEPLGALDLKLREQMKIELKLLQHEVGTTFIYITHDQSEALVMSDRVAVMNTGRFEQVDTPRGLYLSPASRFVAGFVGESNVFTASVRQRDRQHLLLQLAEGLEMRAVQMQELPGASCSLYLRPESVMLQPDPSLPDLNRFPLRVKAVLFDGSNSKLIGTFGNTGAEITVALPQNSQFAHVQPGDRLEAGVHFSACRCYPD